MIFECQIANFVRFYRTEFSAKDGRMKEVLKKSRSERTSPAKSQGSLVIIFIS